VNCTDCPAAGDVGLYVNEAVSPALATVTVRLTLSKPVPFIAVKVTVLESAVV
jgi:hypothetical protein